MIYKTGQQAHQPNRAVLDMIINHRCPPTTIRPRFDRPPSTKNIVFFAMADPTNIQRDVLQQQQRVK